MCVFTLFCSSKQDVDNDRDTHWQMTPKGLVVHMVLGKAAEPADYFFLCLYLHTLFLSSFACVPSCTHVDIEVRISILLVCGMVC